MSLLLLSSFFSASETAYFSLTQAQVRSMTRNKIPGSDLVRHLKSHPQDLLSTILIGNNLVNLFTASYATVVATNYFESAAIGIATGVTTVFILIFGEIIPKSIAYSKNESIARFASRPLWLLRWVFSPLIWGLRLIHKALFRLFKIREDARVTEEEIRTVARLGVEHGTIDYREHEMLERVFRFDDTSVREVMTPLYRVILLNGNVPVEQIAHFVSHDGHSRYPVYEGDEGNIVGYIHINDMMKALHSDDRDRPVGTFAQKIVSVKETTSIERVFRRLNRDHSHIALVRSKGATRSVIGIVTMEDIVEELVGEIQDETDRADAL